MKKITVLFLLLLLTGCSQATSENKRLIDVLQSNSWSCTTSRCNIDRDGYSYEYNMKNNIYEIKTIYSETDLTDTDSFVREEVMIDFEELKGEGTLTINVGISDYTIEVTYNFLDSTTTCTDEDEVGCDTLELFMEIYYDEMTAYFDIANYDSSN